MKKPQWFRVRDLLVLAGTGFATLALTIYAAMHNAEGPKGWQWLMSIVGVAFIIIWLRMALDRRAYLSKFRWYPTYGFMVEAGGYQLPDDGIFDGVVWTTIQRWGLYHPAAEKIVESEINWVFFRKDLDETPHNPAKRRVEGFTFAGTHLMYVDFDKVDSPLTVTAFEHELGHVIHGNATNSWDMEEHHQFAHARGLK